MEVVSVAESLEAAVPGEGSESFGEYQGLVNVAVMLRQCYGAALYGIDN